MHRHIREDLVRLVTSLDVRTVLDVGCGSGENLERLAALGRYVVSGVDLSDAALRLAREHLGPEVRLKSLDVEREALSERFDLVLSIQVVEHIADDVAALRNMAAMSSKYFFTSTIGGRMRPSELAIGHVRNYSRLELRRKLELAGLDVLWVRGWGFPFYSPLYRSVAEWLPGGPPAGSLGTLSRLSARALYQLYRLNVPGQGDVLSALARKP